MAKLPIGAAIRRAREFRRLSQKQLALKMGCPRTYLTKVENGYSFPHFDNFLRIAKALDVEAWRLLRWASRQQTEPPPFAPVDMSEPKETA